MGRLRALFGGKKDRHEEKPPNDVTSKTESSGRSSNVVARLMGLDALHEPGTLKKETSHEKRVSDSNTLVDAADSGKQTRVTSRRKWGSFDDGKLSSNKLVNDNKQPDQRYSTSHQGESNLELQLRNVEQKNEQSVTRNMECREDLMAELLRRKGRTLSDASELKDVIDLFEANKGLFESYFEQTKDVTAKKQVKEEHRETKPDIQEHWEKKQDMQEHREKKQDMQEHKEMRIKTGSRILKYLNGQSSPRPPPLRPEVESPKHSSPGSAIVLLKPQSSSRELVRREQAVPKVQGKRESPSPKVQDRGLAKESPAKSQDKPLLKEHKHIASFIAKKIKDTIAKDIKTFYSSVDSSATSPKKSSPKKFKQPKNDPKPSADAAAKRKLETLPRTPKHRVPEVQEDVFNMDCTKNGTVVMNSHKPLPDKSNRGSPKASPRVTPGLSVRTPEHLKRTIARTKKDSAPENRAEEHLRNVTSSSEERPSTEPITPTKDAKTATDPLGEKKRSPNSVLDMIDDEEFIVDLVGYASSRQQQGRGASKRAVEEELVCPKGREEELRYVKKLYDASTEKGRFDAVDASLFERLEDEYSRETSATAELYDEPEKAQLRALNRWLIFDAVNDGLSIRSCKPASYMKTDGQTLKQVWNGICELYRLQSPGQSLQSLVSFEFRNDEEEEVFNMSQEIENALLNDLLDETVFQLV